MMNLQNEQEICNERQEKNEQAADCESTAKTYLRSILDNDDQPIINTSKDFLRCPKVPPMLRNIERSKDYYDPKFISFGPYHHEKDELQATQKIKTKVMQNFILEHGKEIEDLYNQVRLLNDYSRRCYVDGSTDAYGDEAFALMMLQDGCLILFLIELRIYTFRKNNEWRTSRNEEISSMIKNHLGHSELVNLHRDLLLLENQIPFQVLKVLMCNMYKENEGLTMIKSFLYRIHWGEFPKEVTRDENEMEPDHLLGLLKTLISKCGDHVETVLEKADSAMDVICYLQSFSSVSDLKGIDFKPSNSISLHSALLKEKPKSTSLRDVDFRSSFFSGELKLPPLFVGDQSQLYYTNLIAFEACAPIDCTVTSYINFMNLLIANPKDVKALRSKRIIPTLHSDEDVFTMFKEISATATATNLLDDITMYQGVREKIEEHCNNKIKIWIGEMRHKFFSQPWPVISLLVAVVVIILTFLQTFYTIKPRKA